MKAHLLILIIGLAWFGAFTYADMQDQATQSKSVKEKQQQIDKKGLSVLLKNSDEVSVQYRSEIDSKIKTQTLSQFLSQTMLSSQLKTKNECNWDKADSEFKCFLFLSSIRADTKTAKTIRLEYSLEADANGLPADRMLLLLAKAVKVESKKAKS